MGVIEIVGLGPGSVAGLPYGTLQRMQSGHPVYLRTARHPVVSFLDQQGVVYEALDRFYEQSETFAKVYESMAEYLFAQATEKSHLIYAVPGHPAIAERTVGLLAKSAESLGHTLLYGSGHSFLDDVLLRLGIDPIEGLLFIDASDVTPSRLNPRMHTVIVQMYNQEKAADVKIGLSEVYTDEYLVTVVRAVGLEDERVLQIPLYELDRVSFIDHLTTVYVPPVTEQPERLGEWSVLLEIVEKLRSPEGCPWDIEQTHASLVPYVLEEAYEVVDAIHREDMEDLVGELGDLLLQVTLHSQIGSEEGYFNARDVVRTLSEKLIRRHPHVFGESTAADVKAVMANWERIKQEEKARAGEGEKEEDLSILARVKRTQPPLRESVKLQQKAAEVGFDWPDVQGALDKVHEELNELRQTESPAEQENELGDLLFSVVNVARHLGIDPEKALQSANAKFRDRFYGVEQQLQARKWSFSDATLDILEEFWQNAKEKVSLRQEFPHPFTNSDH
ncbi:nucleoside triphosphate pyrophosphohydrolase [Sulfoacidibacillus thermotolerans]|uniref:Nucleoside triphosphate pyrophosphohydrolase n=1 Tax=Sulfoacidibacillus thermotolerans TaxID=1765684 RepID=A0A2U3DB01_SULT2|nr:nucleoside triphosphate pyrophosphohydrolase [Sulfoacidibacillus thermotolerans]PWI58450.1 nucleoside triphosphate pyrophosphohydrolase [Sulfoacidibacillus thermotolerans]